MLIMAAFSPVISFNSKTTDNNKTQQWWNHLHCVKMTWFQHFVIVFLCISTQSHSIQSPKVFNLIQDWGYPISHHLVFHLNSAPQLQYLYFCCFSQSPAFFLLRLSFVPLVYSTSVSLWSCMPFGPWIVLVIDLEPVWTSWAVKIMTLPLLYDMIFNGI